MERGRGVWLGLVWFAGRLKLVGSLTVTFPAMVDDTVRSNRDRKFRWRWRIVFTACDVPYALAASFFIKGETRKSVNES